MNTRQIPGRDKIGSLAPGKYKTFEGTEISIECVKAKVKDLRVEGKTYQNLADNIKLIQGTVNKDIELEKVRVASEDFYLPSKKYTIRIFDSTMEIGLFCPYISPSVNFKQWTSDCIVWDNNSESNNIRITIRKKDKSAITVDEVKGKIVLLEGDYTNIDLPINVDGIESVTERENINLLKDIAWHNGWIDVVSGLTSQYPPSNYPNAKYSDLIDIDNSILYITNLPQSNATSRLRTYKEDGKTYMNKNIDTFKDLYKTNKVSKQDISKIRILILDSKKTPLPSEPYLIQDGEDINNPYPLKLKINDNTTTLNLPIPLRSLPNGTCDTIEGNKLVQRVGKVVLENIKDYNIADQIKNNNRIGIMVGNVLGSSIRKPIISDHFFDLSNGGESVNGSFSYGGRIFLYLGLSTLEEYVEWFKGNPTTFYYSLSEPIIHDLKIPSISTTKGTNIITTENNIKPKLSMKVKVKK